mmetsp:Transcript_37788/g.73206  ORF Transcript_37788/g.73206 Transcript_37788/m.73206 type:complete len:337 (-) Transcript_37788:36-1046(-)
MNEGFWSRKTTRCGTRRCRRSTYDIIIASSPHFCCPFASLLLRLPTSAISLVALVLATVFSSSMSTLRNISFVRGVSEFGSILTGFDHAYSPPAGRSATTGATPSFPPTPPPHWAFPPLSVLPLERVNLARGAAPPRFTRRGGALASGVRTERWVSVRLCTKQYGNRRTVMAPSAASAPAIPCSLAEIRVASNQSLYSSAEDDDDDDDDESFLARMPCPQELLRRLDNGAFALVWNSAVPAGGDAGAPPGRATGDLVPALPATIVKGCGALSSGIGLILLLQCIWSASTTPTLKETPFATSKLLSLVEGPNATSRVSSADGKRFSALSPSTRRCLS